MSRRCHSQQPPPTRAASVQSALTCTLTRTGLPAARSLVPTVHKPCFSFLMGPARDERPGLFADLQNRLQLSRARGREHIRRLFGRGGTGEEKKRGEGRAH